MSLRSLLLLALVAMAHSACHTLQDDNLPKDPKTKLSVRVPFTLLPTTKMCPGQLVDVVATFPSPRRYLMAADKGVFVDPSSFMKQCPKQVSNTLLPLPLAIFKYAVDCNATGVAKLKLTSGNNKFSNNVTIPIAPKTSPACMLSPCNVLDKVLNAPLEFKADVKAKLGGLSAAAQNKTMAACDELIDFVKLLKDKSPLQVFNGTSVSVKALVSLLAQPGLVLQGLPGLDLAPTKLLGFSSFFMALISGEPLFAMPDGGALSWLIKW